MLRRFLPSVIEHSPEAEIIVADNGSTDESLQLLAEKFPDIRILALERNYGFAEGYNISIQKINKVQKDTYSGDELEQIEARLDVIHRLRRKYGSDVDAILAYLEQARQELDEIEFADDHVERLKKKLKKNLKIVILKIF